MSKKKIIIVCIICLIIIGAIILIVNLPRGVEIYSNTFYFDMGSRRIKIYDNGDVYDDLEIEEPNHKVNYKKIKTLTSDEIKELKSKIETMNRVSLEDYIKKLVYGSTDINP